MDTVITLNQNLAEAASKRLEDLRTGMEVRLAALESVLADPSRQESLEALILDLARMATDEAQLAASKACIDTRLKAESDFAQAQAAAQAAIETERAAAAELHRSHDEAQRAIASLTADLHTAQSHLASERTAVAEMRQAAARTDALTKSVEQEKARAKAADDKRADLQQQVAQLQKQLGDAQRHLAEAQEQLNAERAATGQLRAATHQAEQRLAQTIAEHIEAVSVHNAVQQDLAAARSEIGSLRADMDAARSRAASLEAQASPGAPSTTAHAVAAAPPVHAPAPAETVGEPAAAASQAIVDPIEQSARVPADTAAAPPAGDEDWDPVRLAKRHAFSQPIDIFINGAGGFLFDLSISGCQILSKNVLKPIQAVKVVLPSEGTGLTCIGKVVWARVEPAPNGRPSYRAGVVFSKPNHAAIEQFIASRP